jgi:sugar lactone lactonase YvrE
MVMSRYGFAGAEAVVAKDWTCRTLVSPSRLVGANGMRFGPNGQLYVAQAFGGQISAYDLSKGCSDVVSGADGDIIAPDDLAFDSAGNLFATEVMSARVSARSPRGDVRVIADNVPVANGITVHNDRIFLSEFNPQGRILELFADGSSPRVIASDLMMPNALSMGPDGYLYFPLVPLGEVWRVSAVGGVAERVAGDFDIPTAVKFAPDGKLVVVESGSGVVTALDVLSGEKFRRGQVAFGIDNLAFSGDGRLFVSHFTDGSVSEITQSGVGEEVVPGAMLGPFGLCVNDGALMVADGMSLAQVSSAGVVRRPAMLLEHGFPGYVRGITVADDGAYICTNSAGVIARYIPGKEAEVLADGFDQLMGVAVLPSGDILAAEAGSGNIIQVSGDGVVSHFAKNLKRPTGISIGGDGAVLVTEAAGGRLISLRNGARDVLMDGLIEPHGVAACEGHAWVIDRGSRALLRFNTLTGDSDVVVRNLPVGIDGGVRINTLPGIKDLMPGPLLPFSDLAVLSDGHVCVGCDENGSILVLSQN